MVYAKSSVTILYGSDTGNAQDYAHFLSRRLRYLSLRPTLAALDSYPLKKLVTETSFLVVVCSTVGQGELPRNAQRFMRFLLKKKLPADLLNHIFLTSFGLGDSSYPKFNYGIKKLHTRLTQLGCAALSPRCEADEQSPEGLDGFYAEWERTLMAALKTHFPALAPLDESLVLMPENPLVVHADEPDVAAAPAAAVSNSRSQNGLASGTVASIARVTAADHFQDVRHVVLHAPDLAYLPGDTVGLFPSNDPADVQALLESQPRWAAVADKPLAVRGMPPAVEGGLVAPLTLRNLFLHHFDIMSIPTRTFFFMLWHFIDGSSADGAREKEKVQEFCQFDNAEELYNYANRPRRSILEVLLEFQNNLTVPLEQVFDLMPKIKPRLFSIASRPSATSVELVIAVVEYRTIIKRIRKGLCTAWLRRLAPGDDIVFSVHRQNLDFGEAPIVLIAAGTGIAPMKALVEHLAGTARPLYLFYGFRTEGKDDLFGDLWASVPNLEVFPCVSRPQAHKKQYVQNGVFEHRQLVAELLLERQALIYLCGSSGAMPRQVRETVVEVLAERIGRADAEAYLLRMEDSGRYIQETW